MANYPEDFVQDPLPALFLLGGGRVFYSFGEIIDDEQNHLIMDIGWLTEAREKGPIDRSDTDFNGAAPKARLAFATPNDARRLAQLLNEQADRIENEQ